MKWPALKLGSDRRGTYKASLRAKSAGEWKVPPLAGNGSLRGRSAPAKSFQAG